jgi:hypothetical protein
MPRRIFFRDECASVTSTELVVGKTTFPLQEIQSARGYRRRRFLNLRTFEQYALLITTTAGEQEVLRHRNGYLIFQLAKAIESALREAGQSPRTSPPASMVAAPAVAALSGSLIT